MKRPLIFYLARFPSRGKNIYRNQSYWDEDEEHRAKAFVKHIKEKYNIRGKVIKVIEMRKRK